MAIRKIRLEGDPVLAKKCRPVEVMTDKIHELIGDMLDTMYEHNGVGLAAPQVTAGAGRTGCTGISGLAAGRVFRTMAKAGFCTAWPSG